MICTGNPNQLWRYIEPTELGEVVVEMSEKQILEVYFEWWSEKMKEVGKESEISEATCIDDWIIINWAEMGNE